MQWLAKKRQMRRGTSGTELHPDQAQTIRKGDTVWTLSNEKEPGYILIYIIKSKMKGCDFIVIMI